MKLEKLYVLMIIPSFLLCALSSYGVDQVFKVYNNTNYISSYLYKEGTNNWCPWSTEPPPDCYRSRTKYEATKPNNLPSSLQVIKANVWQDDIYEYSASGIVQVSQAPFRYEYPVYQKEYSETQYWGGSINSYLMDTVTNNYLFLVDDWADSTNEFQHVGVLPIKYFDDTNTTNGYLFKPETWFGNAYTDTDVFLVASSEHKGSPFKLEIVCWQDFTVMVEAKTQFQWNGIYKFTTNVYPESGKNVIISIKLQDSATALTEYDIRINRGPAVILVHGVTSVPQDKEDVDERKVFCHDLDLILNEYGCFTEFHCWNSTLGHDTALIEQINVLHSIISNNYMQHMSNKVAIIAHSWGGIMTALCYKEYVLDFEKYVDKIIYIGSPLAGTPYSNFFMDPDLGIWDPGTLKFIKMADVYKDGPEVGGAFVQKICSSPYFDNSILLNGKWGDECENYYNEVLYTIKQILLPRYADFTSLKEMMYEMTDGFIANYSACNTDIISDPSKRKLVFTDSVKGMAHSEYDDQQENNTECYITFGNFRSHGMFHTLMYYLAGTNQPFTLQYTEAVPDNYGGVCREINVSGIKAERFRNFYTLVNGKEIRLFPQDVDDNSKRNLSSLNNEMPFKILSSSKGTHEVYGKRRVLRCNYNNNWWIVPNITDIESTTTGTVTITGGKVNINNTPLQLITQ